MNWVYKKSEIGFALLWIITYVISLSIADTISLHVGIYKSITSIVCIFLSFVLYRWIYKNDLMNKYGLCKSNILAKQLLYYIPFIIIASMNICFGICMNYTLLETFLHIISMLCVGFLEEVIFRGILFKAMCKDGLKIAVIVSSVTFGIGHIVNLFNGSGVDLFSNLLQVAYAIAAGLVFTMMFYKSGSLWACIITHGILNASSVFIDQNRITPTLQWITAILLCVIPILYTMYLLKLKKE